MTIPSEAELQAALSPTAPDMTLAEIERLISRHADAYCTYWVGRPRNVSAQKEKLEAAYIALLTAISAIAAKPAELAQRDARIAELEARNREIFSYFAAKDKHIIELEEALRRMYLDHSTQSKAAKTLRDSVLANTSAEPEVKS